VSPICTYCSTNATIVNLLLNYVVYFLGKYHKGTQHMGDDFFSSFSYSYGTYDFNTGFNSIGGSGYAGQNVTFQGTTATGFDGFTSNPFITSSTTSGFTQDQSIVGTANYQIGVDYTNNAVSGFANPNTGGAQSLTLDNTYYTIQAGSDAYLTTQFNTLGSIAEIQTLTATVIANTQGVDDTYPIIDTIDNTILTQADDGQSLNVPLSVNQFNVQIKTADTTTVADSSASGLSADLQAQLDQALDTELSNLVGSFPNLATPAGRSLAIQNATTAANILEADGNGFTLTTQERRELQRVINDGLNVAVTTRDTLNQAQYIIDTVRNLSISDSSPVTLAQAKEQLVNSFFDQLTPEEKSIINSSGLGRTFDNLVTNINGSSGGILAPSEFSLVPYNISNNTLELDATQRITNELIAQYIAQNGSITEEQIQAIENLVLTQNAINTQVIVDENLSSGPNIRDNNLIKNQKVSADVVTDTTLPTTDQGDTAIQTVEVTANTSVSRAIRDSLGLPNQGPILEKLIDKAINLGLNQIPGYPQLNSAIGTANKIVSIGDIATNVDLSPAETALALARLFVPQINLVVQGFNLVTGGGDGGGASGVAEALVPIPVDTTVDIQAGGAGEEEDPPPGSIDFGPAAVSTTTDPQVGNDNTTTSVPASQVATVAVNVGGAYIAVFNPATGNYDVVNEATDTVILSGLTQNQANTAAAAYSSGNTSDIELDPPVQNSSPAAVTNAQDPSLYPNGTPYDDDGNLNPGWALDENNDPVYVGGDFVDPFTQASAAESLNDARVMALKQQANSQATIAAQRKQANEGDWRVKLRLAEGADYLYRDPGINSNGILWPLAITNGVVFPYTPQISTNYGAVYSSYDLTHSNYRGYFYQGSHVDEVNITATFTAQDTSEANYMLAVIHFFRSVTKMFYGQDSNRGQPPPLVFLQGLGEFQFNLHPCVVRNFVYNLPNDVDYIRARSPNINGTNLLGRRDRADTPAGPSWLSNIRLDNAGLRPGGVNPPPAPPTLGTASPTYVPTKLDMTISLLPMQTRSQVSKQFSLKQYANGDLIKGGFW